MIIQRINERFPEEFSESDRVLVETIHTSLKENADSKLINMARNNSAEMFENNLFKDIFTDFIFEQYTKSQTAYNKISSDQDYYDTVYSFIAKDLYKWLRSQDVND